MYLSLDLDEPFRCVLRSQIRFEKTNHSLHRKSSAFLVSSLRYNHSLRESLIQLNFVLKISDEIYQIKCTTASSFHKNINSRLDFDEKKRLNYLFIDYFRQNEILSA